MLRHAISLWFLGPLLAQQPTPAESLAAQQAQLVGAATARLQSLDPVQTAWGAYAVAQFRLQECVPAVRKALGRLPRPATTAERCATLALLDALIQTDAEVPAEELAPHLGAGAPTFVLMARQPEHNRESLLRAFTSGLGGGVAAPEWLACGNLLATLRDPGFVLQVLRSPSQLWLTLGDPGKVVELVDGSGSFTACQHWDVPKGLPPIARYRLEVSGGVGAVVVAAGANPVYSVRGFHPPSGTHCSSYRGYPEYRSARRAWLEPMLGAGDQPLVAAIDRPRAMVWRGAESLQRELDAGRREYELHWRALVAACVAAKLVALDPATEPLPALRIVVVDERKDRTVALPEGVGSLPW